MGGFLKRSLDLGAEDLESLEDGDFIELGREGVPLILKGKEYR